MTKRRTEDERREWLKNKFPKMKGRGDILKAIIARAEEENPSKKQQLQAFRLYWVREGTPLLLSEVGEKMGGLGRERIRLLLQTAERILKRPHLWCEETKES